MRLDIDRNDWIMLERALSQFQGKNRADKEQADMLRLRIAAQCAPNINTPPTTPIKSAWPSGDVQRTSKPNNYYDSKEAKRVRLSNTTPQAKASKLTVDDILKDLI